MLILLALVTAFCVSAQAQDARYKRALAIAESSFAQAEGAQPRRAVRSSEPRVLFSSNSDEPPHYLIASPEGKGFAVVSGDERWNELLRESLDASCPVPYVATNTGSGSDSKHIFIIDGYTDKGYYHFNWGWGGSCNGYFTLAKMAPTSSDDYASKTDSHKAFIGLKPLKITTYTVSVERIERAGVYIGGGKKVIIK